MEQVLGEFAIASHGVATRAALLGAGVTRHEIRRRLRSGALIREFPGVYRLGHQAPSTEARYLAAVKACGEGAVLSGLAAAYLLGLLKGRAPAAEVTAPTERRIEGIRTRRSRSIDARDVTTWRRIPVTSVARTLVDIAGSLPLTALAQACHEAEIKHGTTPREVEAALKRRPTSPGAAKLERVLRGEVRVTLSKLESRFLELLQENGLPLPETNRPAGSHRVDSAGPTTTSRWSSIATATTAPAPGSRTAAANAKRTPAATSSAATPTATPSRTQPRCSTSSTRSSGAETAQ